jgi:hypothetical protein
MEEDREAESDERVERQGVCKDTSPVQGKDGRRTQDQGTSCTFPEAGGAGS